MSIYEQRLPTQGEPMNNPFVASFTPEFPFAIDPAAYGSFSSQPEQWRRLPGTGVSGRRLPPPYEDECFDSPPPPPAKAHAEAEISAPAPAMSVQSTVFTIDETGRPVGLGNQTWDSFRKTSARNEGTTSSSVTESTTKGHGDIFDTYYPPTVSLSTGDRFSQLLEAKLGLDSALQTPKSTSSNVNRQDRFQSLPSTGAFEPLMAGGTSLVAEASSSSLNARHSYSSTSGTPWSQATSQISTPSHPDSTAYSLKQQDPFNVERALHDPSQLQISPDLVAAMPDLARFPWQLPAQAQGQAQMVNGFFGQAPFAPSSQSPAMPSQETFMPDRVQAQHVGFAYQAFNVSLPGPYDGTGGHIDFGRSGGMPSASMSSMPITSIPTAGYTSWSATPYQGNPSAFAPTTHPLLPSTAGPVIVPRDTHDASRASLLQPRSQAQHASPRMKGQSSFERSPSLSAAKVVNKPLSSHNAVAGPSISRKRKVSSAIDDGESRSDSSPGMLPPSGSKSSLYEEGEGGEEKKPIVIACHNCRAKKLKCDGVRPKCHHCCRRNQLICEYDTFLRRRGPGKKSKKKRRQESWGSECALDVDADDDAEHGHPAALGQPFHGGDQDHLYGYHQDRPTDTFVPYMNDGETMTAVNAYWSGRHPE